MLEAVRNGRGDMAISRNNAYTNFHLSVQMQLRDLYPDTIYGDAGVLFRVSNPHIGVDSYDGYYVGIRASDQHLFFGRADEEWHQLLTAPMAEPLTDGAWYTLQVSTQGCTFVLSAAPARGGTATTLHYTDPHCRQSGSIGMRVYYAKASWRLLQITAH